MEKDLWTRLGGAVALTVVVTTLAIGGPSLRRSIQDWLASEPTVDAPGGAHLIWWTGEIQCPEGGISRRTVTAPDEAAAMRAMTPVARCKLISVSRAARQ